ncbi:MAG: Serine protease Do-like HtrA [Anaerolineales bacterium]|nr:Serine protease Do-like HtrA [Anaerolineales bacterium]
MLHHLDKAFDGLRAGPKFGLLFVSAVLVFLQACTGSAGLSPVSVNPAPAWIGLPAVAAPAPPLALPASVQIVDDGDERRFVELFEQINPSIVHVHVDREGEASTREALGRRVLQAHGFGGFRGWVSDPNGGSGFLLDGEGHVLTTNRVIAGVAGDIEVTFADGTSAPATLVGADANTDLAVLEVDRAPTTATPLQFADSDSLRVGQRVAALGNPLGYGSAMTVGIVSATARNVSLEIQIDGGFFTVPDLIQTDATVIAGMVGGPLVDLDGRVIGVMGVDTLGFDAAGSTRAGGVSLSVPTSTISRVVPFLLEKGRYPYPWLGVSARDLDPQTATAMNLPPDQHGVLVVRVSSGSPAEKAGLRGGDREAPELGLGVLVGGDVIVGFEGEPVSSFDQLVSLLFRKGTVGETVTLAIIRDGESAQMPLTLEERP